VNEGDLDGILLADANAYSPIQWSVLGAFSNLGRPTLKRIHLIQPRVLSTGGAQAFQAAARYGFDFSEITGSALGQSASGSVWDGALWDHATWSGGFQPQIQTMGASGIGIEAAIALRGQSKSRTTIVGTDVWFDEGTGLLGAAVPPGGR
jgi:hypothetical protein